LTKSIFTDQYDRFCALLIQARKNAGLSQAQLAECLKRPQSYVSKYENKERRLDVVEFMEIAHFLHVNAPEVMRRLLEGMNQSDEVAGMLRKSRTPPGQAKDEET
jgi:transcriptional regulator with XRE-family HTH domain